MTLNRQDTQARTRRPILVGRDQEQKRLREILGAALDGRGALVLISGEAGIGKTTLIRDLISQAEGHGALVLTGGCYDLTATPPYGPWVEIVRGYPTTDDSLPGLPDPLRQGGGMAGIGSQTELFELAHAFFVEVSVRRPLLLVLEDLHWSDPASLELLRYLARTCVSNAIMLLVTYRDDDLTRQHPLFQLLPLIARETDAVRLELRRLTTDDIRDLVAYGGLSEVDTTRLVAYLDKRTGGNPLFTTELLRALEAEGTFALSAEGAQLGELDEDYLPSFVLQVIERRLASLGSDGRQALEIAAVIGQEVSLDLWKTVSGIEQDVLDATIEQALESHIVEEMPNHQELRFSHALIREVLYGGVIPTRRRAWHRRTADVLIASADPDPDTVGFHLEQAGDPRLVDWLVRSGERAERRQALLMAAERFDRAQTLLRDDPERAGERAWFLFRAGNLLRHSDFDRSIQLLEESEAVALAADRSAIAHLAKAHQGLVRIFLNDVRQGLEDMWAGVLALEDLGADDQAEMEHLVASVSSEFGVQGRGTLGLHMANASGQIQDAKALLEEWPESKWVTSPDAFRAAGIIYAELGQPTQARQAFARSREIYETLGDPGQAAMDVFENLFNVHLPYAADDAKERHELIRAAQTLFTRETGVPMPGGPEYHTETFETPDHILSGDWDRADELLNRQTAFMLSTNFDPLRVQLARHRGDIATGWNIVHSYLPEGPATEPGTRRYSRVLNLLQPLAIQLALDAGQNDEALSWLEANDRLLAWSGAVLGRAENHLLWARYQQLSGDLTAAHRHADRALVHASEPRQPLALLAAHRSKGQLETLAGHHADAGQHLQSALELADACATPFERALTLLELARLRAAQGRVDDARQLLAEVRAICEPLKAKPTLERAAELEAQMRQQPATVAVPFGLTAREREVLGLVAEGLTDPEVAERLFLSPRTVSSHLTSIYTKLGVSSRTAATRIAVEQRLL
jgi:DNA-binding CsgD family transcriptional regulator